VELHTALSIRQLGNTVSINSPDNGLALEMKYQNVAYGYFGSTSGFSGAALAYSVNGGYVYLSSSSTWIKHQIEIEKRTLKITIKDLRKFVI
jgi:hypothetical protein